MGGEVGKGLEAGGENYDIHHEKYLNLDSLLRQAELDKCNMASCLP